MYQSTKTYGHELGLSACFRQHKATHSHCSYLHGYALSFKFVFEAETLDDRNWVQDFGGLKQLKDKLVSMFDHKLCVAADDPMLDEICALAGLGVADVLVYGAVGCEAFARMAYDTAKNILGVQMRAAGLSVAEQKRVRVVSCECAEHGANSAVYIP